MNKPSKYKEVRADICSLVKVSRGNEQALIRLVECYCLHILPLSLSPHDTINIAKDELALYFSRDPSGEDPLPESSKIKIQSMFSAPLPLEKK